MAVFLLFLHILAYAIDGDLCIKFIQPGFQLFKYWITHYPADIHVYPLFEQLGPDVLYKLWKFTYINTCRFYTVYKSTLSFK